MVGRVVGLHVYPVKSCRGVAIDSAVLVETGLSHDRVWQVVDADGQPITQRTHRVLATVHTELGEGDIGLAAEGRGSVRVPDPGDATTTVKSLLGLDVPAADGGDEVAAWFSDLLGVECRLAGIPVGSEYELPTEFGFGSPRLTFVDAAQVLVANTASLDWLVERSSEDFGVDRFRPNIVLDLGEPWLEDRCTEFTVGDVVIPTGIEWPRCAIPQIDQDSGERHKEPAVALKTHRWCSNASTLPDNARAFVEGNALFGVGCGIGPAGASISVGDAVAATGDRQPLLDMGSA